MKDLCTKPTLRRVAAAGNSNFSALLARVPSPKQLMGRLTLPSTLVLSSLDRTMPIGDRHGHFPTKSAEPLDRGSSGQRHQERLAHPAGGRHHRGSFAGTAPRRPRHAGKKGCQKKQKTE